MNTEYWNDVASKGAVLGIIMLVSHIFKQMAVMHASASLVAAVGLEGLVAAVLFIYLLYRFAKRASLRFGDETLGFTYSQGLMYIVAVSLFAGVIVGLGGYIYIHYIVGYDNYVEQLVANVQNLIHSVGNLPSSVMRTYDDMLDAMAESPEPSVVNRVFSSMVNYGIWGLIAGLFIAGFTKRNPDIFEVDEDNREEI